METIKLSVTLDLETAPDTDAEELRYLLNLLREELSRSKRFRGRIRRVQLKEFHGPR